MRYKGFFFVAHVIRLYNKRILSGMFSYNNALIGVVELLVCLFLSISYFLGDPLKKKCLPTTKRIHISGMFMQSQLYYDRYQNSFSFDCSLESARI